MAATNLPRSFSAFLARDTFDMTEQFTLERPDCWSASQASSNNQYGHFSTGVLLKWPTVSPLRPAQDVIMEGTCCFFGHVLVIDRFF